MILVPDFGQTISDNQILNLGPFEVQFAENRPFFQEGIELFGIGDILYTRRIGGDPFYLGKVQSNLSSDAGERLVSFTQKAPLLNAMKVSGRNKKGLGVGFFNAIEGQTFAQIENKAGDTRMELTNPLTNYNVAVFSQNLTNNGRVSFLNTNVTRLGEARDANVSVGTAQVFSKDRNYSIQSTFKLSNVLENGASTLGHNLITRVDKVQGEWVYGLSYYEESDTYDPNDLGFLFANNSRGVEGYFTKRNFKPHKRTLREFFTTFVSYEQLYVPGRFANFTLGADKFWTFRNFLTTGLNASISPFGRVDHFESRQFGIPVLFDPSARIGGWYSSDYSKPFALDVSTTFQWFLNDRFQTYNRLNVSPRFQISSRFFLVMASTYELFQDDYGYVNTGFGEDIWLGTRNRDVVVNSITGEFIFTKRMGMDLRFRHYWQEVKYNSFSTLNADGTQNASMFFPVNAEGNSIFNRTFDAFTVDINYKWVFFPGCELQVFFKNNIFSNRSGLRSVYTETFDQLFDNPQINSISAKLLLFIDALYFKRSPKV